MRSIKIFCHIDPSTALQHGITTAGDLDFPLEPERLSAMMRERLVDVAARFTGLDASVLPGPRLVVNGDTWEHVIDGLRQVVDAERAAHVAAGKKRRDELTLVLARGEPHQIRRYHAAMLPDDELLVLARETAFMTFEGLNRFHNRTSLPASAVSHVAPCTPNTPGADGDPCIKFSTVDGAPLDKFQWEAYQKVEAAAGRSLNAWGPDLSPAFSTPTVALRTRRARCEVCGAAASRPSVLVTITWAGRSLSREYDLRSDRSAS